MTDQTRQKTEKQQIIDVFKNTISYGVGFILLGAYFYYLFNRIESGESERINVIILLVYKAVGKTWTLVIMEVIGLITLFLGIRKIQKIRNK